MSWLSYHGQAEQAVLGWFLVPVGQLICLFLAARGALPDEAPTRDRPPLDLEKFYYSSKRYVWGALAANSVLLLVARGHAILVHGEGHTLGMGLNVPTILFGLVYYLALAIIDHRWFHCIAVPLACVILFSMTAGQVIIS